MMIRRFWVCFERFVIYIVHIIYNLIYRDGDKEVLKGFVLKTAAVGSLVREAAQSYNHRHHFEHHQIIIQKYIINQIVIQKYIINNKHRVRVKSLSLLFHHHYHYHHKQIQRVTITIIDTTLKIANKNHINEN